MSIKKQAQKLSELYAKLAEKGTWLEYSPEDEGIAWIKTKTVPTLYSELALWRVADVPVKKIDMSCLVGSDIDCEFGTDFVIGKLTQFNAEDGDYEINRGFYYKNCQVRQNHWHSWQGGECPLPEGLVIAYSKFGSPRRWVNNCTSYVNLNWANIYEFKILGTAEGYKY